MNRTILKGTPEKSGPARLPDLTNSARSTFMNCRKRYEYEYVRKLAPVAEPLPFLVGGLFHQELEAIYKEGWDQDGARGRVQAAIEEACAARAMSSEESDRIWQQEAVVMGMLTGYAAKWLKEDERRWKVLSTEQEFSFKLGSGVAYRGKKDMVVLDLKTRERLLVEHKSAASINEEYVARLALDNQILGYALSTRKAGKKEAVDGVVYNVTRKSYLRPKGTETFEQFARRVEKDYVAEPEKYFYREKLVFADRDIERFEGELERFSEEMRRALKEGYFYRNTTQCTARGVCPFMKPCINGETREVMAMYRVKESAHEELKDEEGK